jgi:hypothetical protein
MKIRDELLQDMYEYMSSEKGVHDEVDEVLENAVTAVCGEVDETSDEYDRCMNALIELEHAAFMAGASMVLDFISGKEMQI